jgi:hypothetical protein
MWRKISIVQTAVIMLGVILQLLLGNIQLAFFAFPMNVALMILVSVSAYYCRKTWVSGIAFSLAVISIWLLLSLCLGLFPIFSGYSRSWVFVLQTLLLLFVLSSVIFRRHDFMFFISHFGMLVAVSGGFWGACDQTTEQVLLKENTQFKISNKECTFIKFDKETQVAYMLTDKSDTLTAAVNHPAYYKGRDIYPQTYNSEHNLCVLLIVFQPWKWVEYAGIGLILLWAILVPFKILNKRRNSYV